MPVGASFGEHLFGTRAINVIGYRQLIRVRVAQQLKEIEFNKSNFSRLFVLKSRGCDRKIEFLSQFACVCFLNQYSNHLTVDGKLLHPNSLRLEIT